MRLNATHVPSARAGFRITPLKTTRRSLRGKLNLRTPPGLGVPFRPSASSTGFQYRAAWAAVGAVCATALPPSDGTMPQIRRTSADDRAADIIVSTTLPLLECHHR